MTPPTPEQVDLVLGAADRRASELLEEASGQSEHFARLTLDEHFRPLRDAIDAVRVDSLPIGPVVVRSEADLHTITIEWSRDEDGIVYESPPIGPFTSSTKANQAATRIRKRLRANNHKHRRVRVSSMVSVRRALSWAGPVDPEEDK